MEKIIINELELGKELFALSTDEIREYIKKSIKDEPTCYPTFFMLVIKYLVAISKDYNISPKGIYQIIVRYSVLFCSILYYDKNNPFQKYFDIDKEKTNEKLSQFRYSIDSKNEFYNIWKTLDYNKEFVENEVIHNIFVNSITYFNVDNIMLTSYTYDNKAPFDYIISELLIDNPIINFEFEIEKKQEKNFKENIIDRFKDQLPLIACIIDNLITNNNLKFDNTSLKLKKKIYYQILTKRTKQMKFGNIKFISMLNDKKIITIEPEEIIPFEFIYNKQKYLFSNEGIIKL